MSNSIEDLIRINLNGKDVEVPNRMNLVDAAEMHGVEIPHYCYHSKLSVAGNCRMCLIEMGTPGRDRATGEAMLNEDGSPKIMWVPKPVIACATNVSPGMHEHGVRNGEGMPRGRNGISPRKPPAGLPDL